MMFFVTFFSIVFARTDRAALPFCGSLGRLFASLYVQKTITTNWLIVNDKYFIHEKLI
jgi:hypothetical protein